MRLYLRLAWRNIWRHRRRTYIVVAAIGFTLAMMMMYDGLVAGFEQAIYGNAIRVLGGNIQVHPQGFAAKVGGSRLLPLADAQQIADTALQLPHVVAASQRIVTSGLVSNAKGAFGVSIVGIEPERERPVNLLAEHVVQGRFLSAEDGDVVFVGKGLADAMGLAVGDRITLAGRAAHEQTRQRTVTVIGVYDVGMAEVEKRTVYLSLAEAQTLYALAGQATEVMISLGQLGHEPEVMRALGALIPGVEMTSWADNYPDMRSAIETKGGVMNIFGVIVLVIVGIGIMNLLLMAVYERTREIGLLGAFGLRAGRISVLFLLEGALLGLTGVAVGVALGLAVNGLLARVGLDFAQFAGMSEYMALISSRVYPTMGLERLAQRAVTVAVITILAAYYPAREAGRREPAQALHAL